MHVPLLLSKNDDSTEMGINWNPNDRTMTVSGDFVQKKLYLCFPGFWTCDPGNVNPFILSLWRGVNSHSFSNDYI